MLDIYDGYHPNAVGEEKMASRWFEVLQSVLNGEVPEPLPDPILENLAPVAANDEPASSVAIGSSLTIDVLSNDTDSDGELDVTSVVTSIPAEAVVQADLSLIHISEPTRPY